MKLVTQVMVHLIIVLSGWPQARAQLSVTEIIRKALSGEAPSGVRSHTARIIAVVLARSPIHDSMNGRCQNGLSPERGRLTHTPHAKIARRANLSRLAAVAVSPKSQASSAPSRLDEEGRYGRSSRNVGAGCDGRGWRRSARVARGRTMPARTEKACGPGVPTLALSFRGSDSVRATGAKEPGPRGERAGNR
jgi:hypothetical protein